MSDKPTIPHDLAQVIATHRAMFGGFTMSAAPPENTQQNPQAPTPNDVANRQSTTQAPAEFVDDETGEKYGFPARTPLSEMTDAQKAEYWRHKSRKWEGEAKGQRDQKPAPKKPAAPAQGEQGEQQAVDVDQIRRDAETAAQEKYAKVAVKAEFKAAFGSRRTADQIGTILENVNLKSFLTRSGEVDTDKVIQYADAIAPKGSTSAPMTSGPDMGQGNRGAGHVSKAAAGLAEAQRRFPEIIQKQ